MNYAVAAEQIGLVAGELLQRAGLEPGMRVLDVACGTGNAAIPAARAGARATGLDPSAELLAIARERAADAMAEVEWVKADPEAMPLDDASFDRVVSVFGHMFAPDHERMAAELLRVCRPGGTIAVASWTLGSAIGRLPAQAALWGTEAHVRELLGEARFEHAELGLDDGAAAYLVAVVPR